MTIRQAIAYAAAVLAVGNAILFIPRLADAAPATPSHDVCRLEDGSGQRICVWNNQGPGFSFVAINGGTARARYVRVSDARAYRLTH